MHSVSWSNNAVWSILSFSSNLYQRTKRLRQFGANCNQEHSSGTLRILDGVRQDTIENYVASKVHVKSFKSKEVGITKVQEVFIFSHADGTLRQDGHAQRQILHHQRVASFIEEREREYPPLPARRRVTFWNAQSVTHGDRYFWNVDEKRRILSEQMERIHAIPDLQLTTTPRFLHSWVDGRSTKTQVTSRPATDLARSVTIYDRLS